MPDQDYREVSLRVWEEMAGGWDRERRWLWDASRAVGEWMVDALEPRPGQSVLELAAGPGDTGFAVAPRLGDGGRLVSTDFSPKMVETARAEAERLGLGNVEARVADAERLEFEDGSFDGVLCRWGYMLMADPDRALRETRRVLRDGGRLALSVWGAAERNPWAAVPARAVMEHTGAPPPDPDAPGIFRLAEPQRVRDLLGATGFDPRRVEEVEMTWRFADFDGFWRFIVEMAGALAMVINSLPRSDQDAIRDRVEGGLEAFATGDGYAVPGMCVCALAV